MKDVLLILCVGAAFLAGFPLMKRVDRWINSHVVPPEEDAPDGNEAGSPDRTKKDDGMR